MSTNNRKNYGFVVAENEEETRIENLNQKI
jgi:hypothetical protein